MRRTRSSVKKQNQFPTTDENDILPVKKKKVVRKNKITFNKIEHLKNSNNSEKTAEESSSDSDLEDYLTKPEHIDFDSTFFRSDTRSELPSFERIEKDILANVNTLSDSESEIETEKGTNEVFSDNMLLNNMPSTSSSQPKLNFQQLHEYTKQIEEVKRHVEKYRAKKESKENNLDINNLLAVGEMKANTSINSAEEGADNSSDFESLSESEKEDWEEIKSKDVTEKSIVPKKDVLITVQLPTVMKQKKGVDLMAAMKRRLNRVRKENQVLVHKVHLLCWIAHGNYVNNVLNNENILGLALSLIPSENCYPTGRTDLKYLEQIVKWYKNTINFNGEIESNNLTLDKLLLLQINKKIAINYKMLVYIFVGVLRSLGIQCRLILSLQVEPLRPPSSELCSVNDKKSEKETKSEHKKVKSNSEKKNQKKITKVNEKMNININKKIANNTKTKEKPSENKSKVRTKQESEVIVERNSRSKSIKTSEKSKGKLDLSTEKKPRTSKSILDSKKTKSSLSTNKKTATLKNIINSKQKQSSNSVHTIPQLDGADDDSDVTISHLDESDDDSDVFIPQLDGTDDNTDVLSKSKKKSNLRNLKQKIETTSCTSNKRRYGRSKSLKDDESENEFQSKLSFTKKNNDKSSSEHDLSKSKAADIKNKLSLNKNYSDTDKSPNKINLNKLSTHAEKKSLPEKQSNNKSPNKPNLKKLNSHVEEKSLLVKQNKNRSPEKSPSKLNLKKLNTNFEEKLPEKQNKDRSPSKVNLNKLKNASVESNPIKKQLDVKNDIINLIKGSIKENMSVNRSRVVKSRKSVHFETDDDNDSDYAPEPIEKKKHDSDDEFIANLKPKVKQRVQPKPLDKKSSNTKKIKNGVDVWVEVFLEAEGKWISVDVIKGAIHCVKEIFNKATQPVSYILAWNNNNNIKDVSKRYCPNWNTVTRKLRIDEEWWNKSLKPYKGPITDRDRDEDEDLARQQLDQPLPKTISEYKDHPLYVLKRHLLKFQALYPPNAPTLGFIRNEPVYSRDCVYTLHSRELWLKEAKVVKLGETPYKIVKARPKYDKLSNTVITDKPLEIFGVWQVEDYVPPTAENGIVPRNAYGNVELFKKCMLPKGTVHLQLPGLNKVARKMNVDCASAVVGFDFHSGWNHAVYDGFVVCEEHSESLIAAWYIEQEEAEKKEQEKYEKRVYGNWKRLIKGLLIRERLKARYNFSAPNEEEGLKRKKNKGPKIIAKKRRICSDSESD